MALINRPIYEHFASRHLAVKGPGAMTNLEEGVMGTLPLDLMGDPAYWYIQGMRVFGHSHGFSAAAGNYGKVGLSIEDLDEQMFAVILSAHSNTTGRGEVKRCLRTDFSSDPGRYGVSTDTRVPEDQPSQCVIVSANSAATPGSRIAMLNDDYYSMFQSSRVPLVVSPGEVIYFQTTATNLTHEVTLFWVEVPAYKAEL